MLLADVVGVSESLAATSKRKEKTALVAALLREAHLDEVPVVIGLLTGALRQGRIGVGWATVRDLTVDPGQDPPTKKITSLKHPDLWISYQIPGGARPTVASGVVALATLGGRRLETAIEKRLGVEPDGRTLGPASPCAS